MTLLDLSRREQDVAALVADGLCNRVIGEILHIAEGTARNHVANILAKTGAKNRVQLAYRMGREEAK